MPRALDPTTTAELALIDGEVNRQATLIAYLGDFRLMMAVALVSTPLLLLIRRPPRAALVTAGARDAVH